MSIITSSVLRKRLAAAAILGAAVGAAKPALADTTGSAETISFSGSTALKNWFVAKTTTFTDVQPGTQISINGVEYPPSLSQWSTNGGADGNALAYQLAPTSYNSGTAVNSGLLQQASAIRFEYHESGSVEGILEMANDQIGPLNYVTQNVDRDPFVGIGNAVWVNYNQFGGKGGLAWSVPTGGDSSATAGNNYHLGDFYSGGQTFALNGTAQPQFAMNGTNLNGGQNAVQVAVSDVIPVQAFASTATGSDPHASQPWLHAVSNPGYGSGDIYLPSGGLGTANSSQNFQSPTVVNMTGTNPRTGTSFGTGQPWNTAGLGNLNSQLVAVTATLFVANPGTGLTQVNRTDAQWLQLQSRLANGATFNMTTRDVNSGTRNVAALETGIDPTWTTGMNDSGNGNALDGATAQITIGPGLKFSNKTAGGNELRPTVQAARMGVGTLSINDASGNTLTTSADPLRALKYYNGTDAGTPSSYVLAGESTIANGTYTIFQNEQFVTLQAPDSSYGTDTNPTTGLSNEDIQGDDATGDVKTLINNTLTSVAAFDNTNKPASPAAGLMSQGFILPQLMQVRKSENGGPIVANTVANGATALQAYNPALVPAASLVSALTMADPVTVTSGSSSSDYGGSTAGATVAGFNGQISITSVNGGLGGNYLFGNFNQTGVRDFYNAVVLAQQTQSALETGANPAGNSAFTSDGGLANSTKVVTGIANLDAMTGEDGTAGEVEKGDLITLGDYNGDGRFDGKDLYSLAFGASLADATAAPVLTGSGSSKALTGGTGTITVPVGENFGQVISSSVLFKNTALDYLEAKATTLQKQEARITFTVATGSPAPTYAGVVATLVSTNVGGNDVYTLDDANGDNAFNPADVNHDGQINLDDAFIVDKFAGDSYTDQNAQEQATINSNGTIDPTLSEQKPFSLVAATLVDYGSNNPAVNKIQQGDMNVMNQALSGVFNYAWYNDETKVGGLNIVAAAGVGSKFQVPTGATFTISSGTFTASGAVDPLTDSTSTGIDTSKSLNVVVNGTGSLDYAADSGLGFGLYKLNSLTVQAGGKVALASASSPANRTLLAVGAVSFPSSTGTLDLANNDLLIHNGNLSNVTGEIAQGQSGHWTGTVGITSSAAAAATNTALGVELNNDGHGNVLVSTFDGQPATTTDVLVKYTYGGDANLDGVVNGSDYTLIDNSFNSSAAATWRNGDFNYDGVINGDDYMLIDNSFNTEGSTSFAGSSAGPAEMIASDTEIVAGGVANPEVPEPASAGLIGIGVISLLGRRRRRR